MKPDPQKCLGYFRVSTQRQATDGNALERYHDQLKRYGIPAEQMFWDVESGKSDTRKGFNEVLRLARSRQFSHIVVPCFDRFQRSALIWEKVRSELNQIGVGFIELDMGTETDLSSPTGILNTQLRAAYAEFQANQNRYHSLQGQKFRRAQHKAFQPCFGYIREGDRLVVNRTEYKGSGKTYEIVVHELIQTFFDQQGSLGKTILAMDSRYGKAREPQHWDYPKDHSGLRYWLGNPLLRGNLVYFPRDPQKRIEVPNTHEALLTPAISAEVLALLERNSHFTLRGREQRNPLVGLVYCGMCGDRMRAKKSGPKEHHRYLCCYSAYPPFRGERTCDMRGKNVRCDQAEEAVIKAILSRAEDVARKMEVDEEQELPPEAIALQQQIAQLKSLKDPDLEEAIAIKETKFRQILQAQSSAQDRKVKSAERLKFVVSNRLFYEKLSVEKRNIFYADLVERVVITNGVISVELAI